MAGRLSALAARFTYAVYTLLGLGILFVWVRFAPGDATIAHIPTTIFAAAIIAVTLAAAFLSRYIPLTIHQRLSNLPPALTCSVLAAVCFAVKLFIVLRYRVQPFSDYQTFAITASGITNGGVLDNARYVALFSHIFGYSAFLSVFYRLFGDGQLVAPIVNVLLSVGCMTLLFFICKRLVSYRAAVTAALIFTLFPSQSLLNIYVLSEPFYTCALLGAFALCIGLHDGVKGKPHLKKPVNIAIRSAAIGLLLLTVNLARPIAAIAVIALVVLFFVVDLPYQRSGLAVRLLSVGVILLVMFAGGRLANSYIERRLGEPPASSPGYSIYVGFNTTTYGRWNAADSDRLITYSRANGQTAAGAQELMLSDAKERIFGGNINFPQLFYRKFVNLYLRDDLPLISQQGVVFGAHKTLFSIVSNGFYLAMVALSVVGALFLSHRKNHSALLLFALFFVGLSAAHMLVEVAFRYHYSAIISFTTFAAVAVNEVTTIARRRSMR